MEERDQRQIGEVEKWVRFKSIRDDLKDDNLTFSEESSRVIYEMGNMELHELWRTTGTVH